MSAARSKRAPVALFVLSGVSGLIYQVIWVRQFGNAFGNTVYSASLVAGVFMAGLGLGGYVLGRRADRTFHESPSAPLRMYGRAEIAIAALGLCLALLFRHLYGVSAAISSYSLGVHGWHVLSKGSYVLRYLAAVLLIAPSTFLMGGTLTMLSRWIVASDVAEAGPRIGALYAANTAGAAIGAFATDLFLVPAVGIFRTELVAIALNAVAGAVALVLGREVDALAPPVPERPVTKREGNREGLCATAVALVLAGFAAMGFEILWFRILSSALGEERAVFSLLLTVILLGIGVGSVTGSWASARYGRPVLLLLSAECLLAVTGALLLGLVDERAVTHAGWASLKPAFDLAPAWEKPLLEVWSSLRPILAVTFVPSVLMGASFPLANASVQRVAANVGERAGVLYLATCGGNVAGCALVGFVLLPWLGMQKTALLLAMSAAASAVPLYLSAKGEVRWQAFAAALVTAAVGISVLALLPRDRMLLESFPRDATGLRQIKDANEGPNETLGIGEIPGFYRELLTNGHAMSSTHPKSLRYMRAFAHVPLLSMEDPKSVLVICFGVGSTTHAASLHDSVTRLDVADLSLNVLEHAAWFAASNHDVLADPRVSVFVNDGRHHLLLSPEGTYDLITLEPPPIAAAGVAALYSREFYELARSRLSKGGYLTQWLPAYQVPEEAVRSAVRAFIDVFPESVLLSGDDNELLLMGTRGPSISVDEADWKRRFLARRRVREDLERVELGNLTEIAGMFAASYRTMDRATRGVLPVTDDNPTLEYSLRSPLPDRRMPKDLFDVSDVSTWCPACLARLPRLSAYLDLRQRIYASDFFLLTSMDRTPSFDLAGVPGGALVVSKSEYLERLLGGPATPARHVALLSERTGDLPSALLGLEVAQALDPADAGTYEQLARVLAGLGRADEARSAAETALRLRSAHAP